MASKITKTNSFLTSFKQTASAWATRENVIAVGTLAAGYFFGPYAMAGGLALWAQDRFLGDDSEVTEPEVVRVVKRVEPKKADPKMTRAVTPVLRPQFKPPFHIKGVGLEDTPYSVASREEYDALYGDLPDAPQKAEPEAVVAPALAGGASLDKEAEKPPEETSPALTGPTVTSVINAPGTDEPAVVDVGAKKEELAAPVLTPPADTSATAQQKKEELSAPPLTDSVPAAQKEKPVLGAPAEQGLKRVTVTDDPLRTASQTALQPPALTKPAGLPATVPAAKFSLRGPAKTGSKPPVAAPLPVGLPGLPLIKNAGSTCYLSSLLWAFFFDDPLIEQRVKLAIATREEIYLPEVLNADTGYQVLVHLNRLIQSAKEGKPIGFSEMNAFRNALMKHVPEMVPDTLLFYDKNTKTYFERRVANPMGQKDAEAALSHLMRLVFDERAWQFSVEKRIKPEVDGIELVENPVRAVEENAWHIPLTLPFDEQGKIRQGVSFGAVLDSFFHEDYTDVPDGYKVKANYAAKNCQDRMPCTVEEIRRKWTRDFPPFLAVVQKRFLPTRQKLQGAIEAPNELMLHESVSADGRSKAVYRLKAAVYHKGGVAGGHYMAFVRNSGQDYFCDDLGGLPSKTDEFLAGADHGYILKYELVEVVRN